METNNETTEDQSSQNPTKPFICISYNPDCAKLEQQDEPIDLTLNNDRSTNNELRIMTTIPSDFPRRRRIRRKLIPTSDGKLYLVNESNNVFAYEPPELPNKMELMMSAKSLFSKRTRTLYHWMYPTASKQQIKLAVCSAWEALSPQDKDVYVSQVMAKFGFPQSNLMVNPQLENIKDLAPLPEMKDFGAKAFELQNAISSISQDVPGDNKDGKGKRKRPGKNQKGRKKSSNSSSVYADLSQDFQDDPELSQELAQFAMFFKNKI